MSEQELIQLMYINKENLSEEEFKVLHHNDEEAQELLEAEEDLMFVHLLCFAKKYNVEPGVLGKLMMIKDPKDLLTIYFYYKALRKVGPVTPYIIDKLMGIRCVGYDEIKEVNRTIYEYMNPEISLEDTIRILSVEAEELFESALLMAEERRDFIFEVLSDFQKAKDSFKAYDKLEALPVNKVLQDESYTKEGLSRRKLKKISAIVNRFNNRELKAKI